MAQALFAAGCFWGVESTFRKLNGVTDTAVGYCGGTADNPTYEQVCGGRTGHAETVLVDYDPAIISFDALLDVFWTCHDPTTKNRQGWDIGTQYRSVIFVQDDAQGQVAETSMLQHQKSLRRPIVTEIVPLAPFWRAEEYHQQYHEKQHAGLL